MTDIKFKIQFHSPWHCGSGLSAGADVDALVIKDEDKLPFIPGKTLKGLIREAVEDFLTFTGGSFEDCIKRTFGEVDEKESNHTKGEAFFTNAYLDECDINYIKRNNLQTFLYKKISSTAINEEGVAEKHSLRSFEVVVPCTLYASILFVDESFAPTIIKSLGLIKRLGMKRNRGLGRCTISLI